MRVKLPNLTRATVHLPSALVSWVIISTVFLPKDVFSQLAEEGLFPLNQTYREILDPTRDLILQWRVDSSKRTIAFQVEFRTTDNYVVIGLILRKQLPFSDILVVGGRNGDPFVVDMHSYDNNTIRPDSSQNWHLIGSRTTNTDNGARTTIRIQRDLDTCDAEDVIIKELINVSWDYGGDDQTIPPLTFQPRGSKPIFFLDPVTLPISVNSTQVRENASLYRLLRQYRIPPRRTSYWCSIHKFVPSLTKQHHIVGFDAYFENELARKHVHHQLLYRCSVPSYMDPVTVFDSYANQPGEECYMNADPQLPSGYCRELVHSWAIGGELVLLPESIGIPIGDTPNEYFMFEAHYDNPEELADLEVVNGVDLLYTPQLRPNDASILLVGYGVFGTFVVPPYASEFDVVGHCGSICSAKILSKSSSQANIMGVALLAHTAARRIRLRQYRGATELPWVQDDQDYHYDYQQFRFYPQPVPFLPSDHLSTQCGYDTQNRNGSALASGYSTSDEMCMAFIFIDKRLPYLFCSSEYPVAQTMNKFGIKNMTWEIQRAERVVNIADNPNLVGLTLSEVAVAHADWTPEQIAQLENEQMLSSHIQNCVNTQFVVEVLGITSKPVLSPVQDLVTSITSPTLNTMETPIPNLLPVKFPLVTAPYSPPTCPK